MQDPRQQLSDEELSALFRAIDHPAPTLRAERVMALSRARRLRRSTLLAAATVVLAATVASAAVPGSPVRTLIDRVLAPSTPRAGASAPAQAQAPDDAVARGIAFVPEHRTRISFAATQPMGSLRVRLTSGASLRITQTSSDRDAQFALTPDGVSVSNGGSTASYEILIPISIADARIHIAGKVVYSKAGVELSCDGTLDPERSCLISMQRARSGDATHK
jgi:hypothetical protein